MAPQEKWLSARGERKESRSGSDSRNPPTRGPPQEKQRVSALLWSHGRSISSLLLISKAHYFVLCLAPRQSLARELATAGSSHSPWPFTRTIIYFGEFLGYCFVRANQVWVINDPGGVVARRPSISGARGQIHFWKFHVNYSRPWLWGRAKEHYGDGGPVEDGQRREHPPSPHSPYLSPGWGHNTNNRARIRHGPTFNWRVELENDVQRAPQRETENIDHLKEEGELIFEMNSKL